MGVWGLPLYGVDPDTAHSFILPFTIRVGMLAFFRAISTHVETALEMENIPTDACCKG